MADAQTFTHPADIAGIQEANTAVLPSGMPLNDLLLRSSQLKWAHDEAAKQREEKQLADNLKMFDFNTVGVWDKDVNAINKIKDDGIKQFGDVNFLNKYNAGDLGAITQYQNWKTGLDSAIDLSKRRMVYDSVNRSMMNKDIKYQNDINANQAEQFANTPLSNNFYSMQVTPSANPMEVVEMSKKFAPDISTTTETNLGTGQTQKQVVTTVPLTGNKSLQSAADDILKDTDQMKNVNQLLVDAKTTHDPNEYYITYDFTQVDKKGNPIPIKKKVADLNQQDIVNGLLISERYKPVTDQTIEGSIKSDNGSGDGINKPSNLTWVIDGLVDIKRGTGQTTTDTKSTEGNNVKMSQMFVGQKIPQGKDENGTPIMKTLSSITNKDGKTYVTFAEDQSSTGKSPLVPINNEWNEIVLPIIQDKYGDNAIEELKQYAIKKGVTDVLGIPTLTPPTQSSGTQQQGGVKPKEDFRKKYNY